MCHSSLRVGQFDQTHQKTKQEASEHSFQWWFGSISWDSNWVGNKTKSWQNLSAKIDFQNSKFEFFKNWNFGITCHLVQGWHKWMTCGIFKILKLKNWSVLHKNKNAQQKQKKQKCQLGRVFGQETTICFESSNFWSLEWRTKSKFANEQFWPSEGLGRWT